MRCILQTLYMGIIFLVCSCKDDKGAIYKIHDKDTIITAKAGKTHVTPTPVYTYSNDSITVNAYDYNGLAHFLNKKNDTTYVVNFWATWCVPCVKELPYFEELNAKYNKNKVKVLLVSLDMHKTIKEKLLPFIQSHQLKSDVVILRDPDADSWIRKIDTSWSGALPATLIYNSEMHKFYEQSFTYNELEKEVSNFK